MSNPWINKLYDNFTKMAEDMDKPGERVIKLKSPSMNWMVDNGGIVESKSVLLYGRESSGKSLLAQLYIIELQRMYPDSIQIWIDSEFSFNPKWFVKLGGDASRLLVRQTNDPLEIFDWIETKVLDMLQEGAPINGIVIDSVRSIRYPGDVKDKSTDLAMGGTGAKYLSSALKGLLSVVRRHNITTFLIQQVYEELDPYKKLTNPWVVPDGRALKHFSDYMLMVDRIDTKAGRIEEGKNMVGSYNQVGHKVRVKATKNRVGAPYRVAEFTLHYEKGIINTEDELFYLAKSLGVIFHPVSESTGRVNNIMWQFADYEPVRGEANMRQWIREHPELHDEIFEACSKAHEKKIDDERKSRLEDKDE